MSATTDLIALSLLPLRLWPRVTEQLRSGLPPPEILRRECEVLARTRGESVWDADAGRLLERAARAADTGSRAALAAVPWSAPDYPAALLTIADPPPVLWTSGDVRRLAAPAVAIIGSRGATPYAEAVAEALAADLASCGVAVVSGLARGVDSAAHRGAMAASGVTVAVLGCGADVVYPRDHARLASEISRTGVMVSELLPGTRPRREFFPRRNRIISGLSRAVVVVEAGEKSGSLITARCALEQGRDVLAVPGNVLTGRNKGAHALLRDGARLVESAADVLDELGLPTSAGALPGSPFRGAGRDPVLEALTPGEASSIEDISSRSGLPAPKLLPRLFELELQGRVRRAPGGRFVRFDRPC